MIKYLMAAVLALTAASAQAHGSSHPVPPATGKFVSSDVATGVTVTNRFTYNSTGRLLFCRRSAEYRSYEPTICTVDGKNAWEFAETFVPPGRTYVGFQLMYASGDWYIALYYK